VSPAVIASQRVRAKRGTMTGSAKQSISPQRKYGLLRFARNDEESGYNFAPSRRDAPEALMDLPPLRGRGERRMPAAPAASCALCIGKKHTSKRVHRNHPAFPHAMVLTVYFVLSPVTGLFCHRRQRTCGLSAPGRADLPSANLTPASGRQDHTTSPYATTSLVRVLLITHKSFDQPCNPIARKTLPRPPHSTPRP
jgi:hypothetical protein